jgi:RNA ligase (TIGR02306 family)
MNRKLATIETILEKKDILFADNIEKVKVRGWWVVVKKNEFSVGDLCVYFEIDSLLPVDERFSFMAYRGVKSCLHEGKEVSGYKLRTIKLKGELSQGLALSLHIFPEIQNAKAEDDVSELLNVIKYEAVIPAQIAGIAKGLFPDFIPKTDEERVQNMAEFIERNRRSYWFCVTEKLDGTSCTIFKKDNELRVCSRNLELKETEENIYWKIARKLDSNFALPENYAFQGEIIGAGIQGNPYKMLDQKFFCFGVYDINLQEYLAVWDWVAFCKIYHVTCVTILAGFLQIRDETIDDLLAMADGKSSINENQQREGLVFRQFRADGKKHSFKAISNKYLLNEK